MQTRITTRYRDRYWEREIADFPSRIPVAMAFGSLDPFLACRVGLRHPHYSMAQLAVRMLISGPPNLLVLTPGQERKPPGKGFKA
jgi:hypothetical protein